MVAVLEVEDLTKSYPIGRLSSGRARRRVVLRDLDFVLHPGETVGVVGESGSGKSTLVRCILRLTDIDSGRLQAEGWDYTRVPERKLARLRSHAQMVFQDPFGSLDDRWRIDRIVAEPLFATRRFSKQERRRLVEKYLGLVGLDPTTFADRYPEQLSGGQRQRVAIARALVLSPRAVILDESVAALDVVTQGEILNLLNDLQVELELSYIFISHDIAVVSNVADRIVVMFEGQIVEEGSRDDVIGKPSHPYTAELLRAVPGQGSLPTSVQASVSEFDPDLDRMERGCPFRSRCPIAIDNCAIESPLRREISLGHAARCHLASGSEVAG